MPRFELSGPETRGGSRGGSSQERQVWTRAAAQAWGWAGLQAVCGERAIRGTRLHLQKQHLAVAPKQSQTGHGAQSREGAPLKAQGCLGDRACPTWGTRGLPPVLKGDGAWGRSLGGRRAWAPPGQRQGAQSTQLVVGGGQGAGFRRKLHGPPGTGSSQSSQQVWAAEPAGLRPVRVRLRAAPGLREAM